MRSTSSIVLGGLTLAGLAAACGYPDFEFRPRGEGGTTTAGGVPTGSGLGGLGGTGGSATGTAATTGTGTAGTGGSGNTGGTAPTGCSLWPEGADGCPDGEKCSVVNESTGFTDCVAAGQWPAWARCSVDADCQDRLWCDHATGVCKPICQDTNNCPSGASCLAAYASGGGPIPSLQVCTAHCDPRNANSCNQTNGVTNCLYGADGFDCFPSGTDYYPDTCSGFLECGPPQTCHAGFCRPWCDTVGYNCPPLVQYCHGYPGSGLFYDGTELGFCSNIPP
ncbi:MAG: hypothetical protein JRI23_08105 [Deltaproteobacteria bacterium]|jgi:hypothetical protein|nr:hypothetical protein [Deltaproteobacteria bacterium]MBW2531575.1 hypothetical protein [Deltaproteobacteria bacterium]